MKLKINLINELIEGQLDKEQESIVLKTLSRNISKIFDNTMPKKYLVFPQNPKVYLLSRCLCIEVPSYGNTKYISILRMLKEKLYENFVFDTQYFDGKTTFIIKKNKNRNLYI